MATYWVSGVWKNKEADITALFVHQTDDTSIYPGVRMSVAQCIALIRAGHVLMTCRYTYDGTSFIPGAVIEIINSRFGDFLRTVADAELVDNLDSMIPMSMFER